ncbi:hypothetical protein PybrP1_003282 [[Pythium] brassicae (nom. inval.)]|nr:hypothetical protein PybrP1_003282 [[Pythium] brassicae (nom. inval.)]
MSSPLAFSSIAISPSAHHSHSSSRSGTSDGDFDAKRGRGSRMQRERLRGDATKTPPSASNPLPVLIHVRKERLLLGTLLFAGATTALMLVFSRGVVVARFEGPASSDENARRQRALDDFNFYVGAVTALFVKPLLAVVALVVPVALLCFATRAYMQKRRSWQVHTALLLVTNAVVWLLSNGFHGANVHLAAPRVRSVLRSADLSTGNEVVASGTTIAASVDTILRSAILPHQALQQRDSDAQCTRQSPRRLPALVKFGFASRGWFQSALATSPSAVSSLKCRVSELPDVTADLPLTRTAAQSLFTATLFLMNDFFRDPTASESSAATTFNLEPTSIRESDAALYRAMHGKLRAVFNASSLSFPHFSSFHIEDAELALHKHELSAQISFESLTLDTPLDPSELRRRVFLEPRGDTTQEVRYGNDNDVFEINPKEECSALGCVISAKGERLSAARMDFGSQVRALAICVDSASGAEDWSATLDATAACATQSDRSVLVFSFAKRITGDALEVALNSTAGIVKLSNPTKHYTITVGRLSWAVSDLADTFNAACDADEGCEGLTLPLQDESDLRRHLIVGKAQLPKALRYAPPIASSPQRWGTMLVSSNVQEIDDGGALKSDLVFPHNFRQVTSWDGAVAGSRCEVERGAFLDHIARGHMYSEDSLQPAYTAALFWLFQNAAAVRETRSLSSGGATTGVTLAFSGNVESVEAELSVPRFSAILTSSGCVVLLLLGIAVQLGGKRREAHIERFFSAHHLARLVLDDATLPRQLVMCDLLSVANDRLGSSEHLDEFEISGLALRHCKDPGNVLHVPQPPSTSVSSSFQSAAP